MDKGIGGLPAQKLLEICVECEAKLEAIMRKKVANLGEYFNKLEAITDELQAIMESAKDADLKGMKRLNIRMEILTKQKNIVRELRLGIKTLELEAQKFRDQRAECLYHLSQRK